MFARAKLRRAGREAQRAPSSTDRGRGGSTLYIIGMQESGLSVAAEEANDRGECASREKGGCMPLSIGRWEGWLKCLHKDSDRGIFFGFLPILVDILFACYRIESIFAPGFMIFVR